MTTVIHAHAHTLLLPFSPIPIYMPPHPCAYTSILSSLGGCPCTHVTPLNHAHSYIHTYIHTLMLPLSFIYTSTLSPYAPSSMCIYVNPLFPRWMPVYPCYPSQSCTFIHTYIHTYTYVTPLIHIHINPLTICPLIHVHIRQSSLP